MHIHTIRSYHNNNYNNLPKQTTFRGWERTVYEGTSKHIKNCNYTYFGRDSEILIKIIDFMDTKFKNFPKINLYSLGCSDGSEPMSLVMLMIASKRENLLKKISPIIARDIDPVAIAKAKANQYEIYYMEKYSLNKALNGKYNRFVIEPQGPPEFGQKVPVQLMPEIYRHIDFAVGDANTEIEKINPKEANIILIRNAIPYMGTRNKWTNQKAFFEKLYNQLGENSYIALGNYDFERMGGKLHRILRKAGFAKTEIPNFYRKKSEAEKAIPMTLGEKIKEFFQVYF